MSITEYNGSAVLAMVGKDCVAIASDTRFGVQQQTLADDFDRIHRINDYLYVGMPGLITDVLTLKSKFQYRVKLYELREERQMSPKVFSAMTSAMLYEKRFGPYFVEPIIAGLQDDGTGKLTPYIYAMDLIGAGVTTDDFLVGGTASEELYGTCEALFRPNLEPEELFETISQALLSAVDRDCLSGWGAVVHIITKDGVLSRNLKSRQD
jgi:20S proteasome subunit beta 3